MKELTVKAVLENLDDVLAFIGDELEMVQCSMKIVTQMQIAVEEIFVNIASYAYEGSELGTDDQNAKISVDFDKESNLISVTFEDRGIPYNPLEKPDPDVSLPAEKRQIGGLGIFMVKKSMDDMIYRFEDGKNILTIKKYGV